MYKEVNHSIKFEIALKNKKMLSKPLASHPEVDQQVIIIIIVMTFARRLPSCELSVWGIINGTCMRLEGDTRTGSTLP